MTFDRDLLRPMLLEANGNVLEVALKIGADSEELRDFIMSTPPLRRALDEVVSRGVDQSIAALFDGLEDKHLVNRLAAAKVFLKSRPAQRRGFHHNRDLELKVPKSGALTLTWLPQPERPEPKLIEGSTKDDQE